MLLKSDSKMLKQILKAKFEEICSKYFYNQRINLDNIQVVDIIKKLSQLNARNKE